MELEFKQVMEFKAEALDGNKICGYGAVFGNIDSYNDIIVQGAFAKSLEAGRKVKMLWQHDSREVIGVWNVVREDEKGLYVEGEFANTPRGNEAKELVRIGALDSFSIGYKTIESEYDVKGYRLLKEIALFETSIVTFPANTAATITAVKAAEMSKTDLEKFLIKAGMSRSCAKAVVAKGHDGLINQNLRKADDTSDNLEENNIETNEAEAKAAAEILSLLNNRIDILNKDTIHD